MGFYAFGEAEVTVPTNSATLVALATNTLPEEVRNGLDGEGDMLLRILEKACRFEVWSDETDETGVRTIRCTLGDYWTSATGDTVRWLAEQGCGIKGQFTPEESDPCGYNTPVGHGNLIEFYLRYVPINHADIIQEVALLKEAFSDTDVQSLGLPHNLEEALTEVLQKANTP